MSFRPFRFLCKSFQIPTIYFSSSQKIILCLKGIKKKKKKKKKHWPRLVNFNASLLRITNSTKSFLSAESTQATYFTWKRIFPLTNFFTFETSIFDVYIVNSLRTLIYATSGSWNAVIDLDGYLNRNLDPIKLSPYIWFT